MSSTDATIDRSAKLDREITVDGEAIPGAGGRVHLVGGLGAGLRAAGEVLLGTGAQVTASDRSNCDTPLPDGFRLSTGHAAENVPCDGTLVIRSDAIDDDNVEIRRARALDIPVLSYFDWLGRISADRPTTAIAGTHGKSTTTAMLGRIMRFAGLDPLIVCGAAAPDRFSGGRSGAGELIVEACEYRRNFLKLRPSAAAILGIEDDHFDCYPTRDLLEESFESFAKTLPESGRLLVRHSCETSLRIARSASAACVDTFGFSRSADWSGRLGRLRGGCYDLTVCRRGRPFCTTSLRVPGRHHALAATAVAAMAADRGVSAAAIARGLAAFTGIERRMQRRVSGGSVEIYDDYAHHPSAVAVAIDTIRKICPTRRLVCVFQPHRRLRTERLMEKLAQSLAAADLTVVTDVYLAREEATGGDSPAEVADRLARLIGQQHCNVVRSSGRRETERRVLHRIRPKDVLLLLGAGDVDRYFR